MNVFFSDPLKLIPLAICAIAGLGLAMGKMDVNQAIGLLVASGIIHSGISAMNNVNPPK